MSRDKVARSRRYRVALAAFFLTALVIAGSAAFANPFTGNSGGDAGVIDEETSAPQQDRAIEPSPVRASRPSESNVNRQLAVRERLAALFHEWKKTGSPGALWAILGAAFAYGILHALGPGHRKTIVFSLYLARTAPAAEPALVGALLALLHGGAAVVVLLALRGVSGAISARAAVVTLWMEGLAYALLVGVSAILSVRALCDLFSSCPKRRAGAMGLGTLLVSGLYPCPGAILILILSLALDLVPLGIMAVAAMSLGMSFPITAAGYLAWFGRTRLFMSLKMEEAKIGRLSAGAELVGYLLLLGFSAYIAVPFFASLARMLTSASR